MIVSLTGPSGVGKTTLLHNLLAAIPEASPLVSYTTRERRPSDVEGEYSYISQEEFSAMSTSGEFLWEARTYINRYGTRKADIDRALDKGFYLPVLVIDAVKKLHDYAASVGKTAALRSIYIEINDEQELRNRFAERGDKQEEVEVRIKECNDWNKLAKESGVPFIYLQATNTREEILADALAAITK